MPSFSNSPIAFPSIPLWGIDFTSAPKSGKPITAVRGTLLLSSSGQSYPILRVEDSTTWEDPEFQDMVHFLEEPGPWMAAFDFPFSLPPLFLERMGWALDWPGQMAKVTELKKEGLYNAINTYKKDRKPGDKFHCRPIDKEANARSPMMMHYTPVGKMLAEGAPRLWQSGSTVLPFASHPPNLETDRIVVEGYPAVVARHWLGKTGYKSDNPKNKPKVRRQARETLITGLSSHDLALQYGFSLDWGPLNPDELIEDHKGDILDAVLCLIQCTWAYLHQHQNFGIPNTADTQYGWIPDPSLWQPEPELEKAGLGVLETLGASRG